MVKIDSQADSTKGNPDVSDEGGTIESRFDFASRRVEPINDYVSDQVRSKRTRWYGRLVDNYLDDDADGLATFIAFNAIFAFMPVVLTLAIGLAVLLNFVSTAEAVGQHDLTQDLPEAIAEPVQQMMLQSSDGLLGIGIITLMVLFWGGSRLYNSLDKAFSRIYRTPRRPWVKRKIVGIILVPTIAVVVVLTTLIIPLFIVLLLIPLSRLIDFVPGLGVYLTSILFLYAISFTMMIVAYTAVPFHSPTVRAALPGAAFSAFLFLLLMFIFPLYMRFFGGYTTYGAVFGLILTIMFWFYLASQIIVIGAEINAYSEGRRSDRLAMQPATEPDQPAE